MTAGKTPAHDVLLTNPPYSGEHKQKLYNYILDAQRQGPKPFMLLLPAWSASKAGWRQFLHTLAEIRNGNVRASLEDASGLHHSRLGDELERQAGVCYVCPGEKYEFIAAGNCAETAPFFGIWFCGGLSTGGAGVARAAQVVAKAQAVRGKSRSDYKPSAVHATLKELKDAGIITSDEEARAELLANPAQKAARDAALKAQNAIRKADPAEKARIKAKKNDARYKNASRYCPLGAVLYSQNDGLLYSR